MTADERSPDWLSAYLDGECSDAERAEFEAQLAADPDLRAELDEVAATRDLVRGLDRPQLRDDDLDTLIASVAAEPIQPVAAAGPPRATGSGRRGTGRVSRIVAGAAAGVAVAAAVVAVAIVPNRAQVTPPVGSLVTTHAAQAGIDGDPISHLAPVVVPAGFRR